MMKLQFKFKFVYKLSNCKIKLKYMISITTPNNNLIRFD